MLPRIKELIPKDNFLLYVTFDDGKKVAYDVMEDIKQIPSYIILQTTKGLFKQIQLNDSRTCVYWNENIDLPSDTIYEYGKEIAR